MIVLMGKAAAGKTSVLNYLCDVHQLHPVISYTTREPRSDEVHEVDYNFISEEKFLQLQQEGFFAEYVYFSGNYYGKAIEDLKKVDAIMVIEPVGAKNLLDDGYLDIERDLLVYLDIDSITQRERLLQRGAPISNMRLETENMLFDDINCLCNCSVNTKGLTVEQIGEIIMSILHKRKQV